ncbi:hypothetical protein [Jeotgalibacillus haloalkalitolerans]|uniref:NTP pyrophosphohydrolase MazG putative catalytic core domain-containing protein n=1 Tax=Jeotgalibacillus haloalkalitolerans TaxID=3104292 RepID=A0ABU5KK69_9BACL|nr:hypothetical protein [Jeotgalibacillus sp. HH7-29]MDZ5711633.1 hypothetical protein [Jeotgalibacillus sp. HH7-29]
MSLKLSVLQDVCIERERQDQKWGVQRHDMATWLVILVEEVGELAQAIQRDNHWGKSSDADNSYTEAVQISAVAAAIAEQLKEEAQNKAKMNDPINQEL